MAQRLDEVGERLPRSLSARAENPRAATSTSFAGRLRREVIDQRIARLAEKLAAAVEDGRARPSRASAFEGVMCASPAVTGATVTYARDARAAKCADPSLRRR